LRESLRPRLKLRKTKRKLRREALSVPQPEPALGMLKRPLQHNPRNRPHRTLHAQMRKPGVGPAVVALNTPSNVTEGAGPLPVTRRLSLGTMIPQPAIAPPLLLPLSCNKTRHRALLRLLRESPKPPRTTPTATLRGPEPRAPPWPPQCHPSQGAPARQLMPPATRPRRPGGSTRRLRFQRPPLLLRESPAPRPFSNLNREKPTGFLFGEADLPGLRRNHLGIPARLLGSGGRRKSRAAH
jgi:hypothetical protein